MQDLPSVAGYLSRYDEDSEEDVRHLHVRAIPFRKGERSLHTKAEEGHETARDFWYVLAYLLYSMQDACHRNFVIVLASERGIRRSEVRFLMGTQNFFLVPCS